MPRICHRIFKSLSNSSCYFVGRQIVQDENTNRLIDQLVYQNLLYMKAVIAIAIRECGIISSTGNGHANHSGINRVGNQRLIRSKSVDQF